MELLGVPQPMLSASFASWRECAPLDSALPPETVLQLSVRQCEKCASTFSIFFGLGKNPFCDSPDPHFYFSTRAHDPAIAELVRGIDTPQGINVLTGEAGTGKTTLLNHFLNCRRERKQSSSYVFHPLLKSVGLFEFILRDFGLQCETTNKGDLLAKLHQWLIRRHAMAIHRL
jgi:type II secretory pathway predicted ATPase ExeA